MILFLASLFIFTLICPAADGLQDGYVLPGFWSGEGNSKSTQFQFHGKVSGVIAPDETGRLSLTIKCKRDGKTGKLVKYSIKDLDGKILDGAEIKSGKSHIVNYENLSRCIRKIEIDAHGNIVLLTVGAGRCSFEAKPDNPLRPVDFSNRLYVSVNNGKLKLCATGATPDEHIAITIRDGEEKVVFKGDSLNRSELKIPVDIPIPKDQDRKIWSIQFGRVGWRKFEDMGLSIESGASPVVSLSPDQLIIPIFNKESKILENGNAFIGFSVSHCLIGKSGYSGTFSFREANYCSNPAQIQFDVDDTWNAIALFTDKTAKRLELKNETGSSQRLVGIEYPKDTLLCGEIHFVAYDDKKNKIMDSRWNAAACGGNAYTEQTLKEPIPVAEPTIEDQSRGFQLFQREEPGFIRLNSRPAKHEICSEIRGETSPGLVSCEFFTVLPLKTCVPNVTIGRLKGPREMPETSVQLLSVRMWPQQRSKRIGSYAVIPELLLPEEFPKWEEGVPCQYCIRVNVPKNTPPGVYTAPIQVNGNACANYRLVVDDFILPEYNDMTFGLYADGQRWLKQNFTDDEILHEMRNFREHGINALMHYPLSGSVITYENGAFHVDLSKFRRIMQLYQQIGFPGVAVFSLQGLDSRLANVLGKKVTMLMPEFEAGLKAVLKALHAMALEEKWTDYCIHVIDEPTFRRGRKRLKLV